MVQTSVFEMGRESPNAQEHNTVGVSFQTAALTRVPVASGVAVHQGTCLHHGSRCSCCRGGASCLVCSGQHLLGSAAQHCHSLCFVAWRVSSLPWYSHMHIAYAWMAAKRALGTEIPMRTASKQLMLALCFVLPAYAAAEWRNSEGPDPLLLRVGP
jgi:hypothetical protein